MEYVERTYRKLHRQQDLIHFQVAVKETDLDVAVQRQCFNSELVELTKALIEKYRNQLEKYIAIDPEYATTLQPHPVLPEAPPMVIQMAEAAKLAGVGPMAAVAGAFSQLIGNELLRHSDEVIIENGGDIYICCQKSRCIGIFAAQSPFTNRIGLEIPAHTPMGVCTSSGTVGHSLSFGKADAVVVLAPSVMLADAVATSAANKVQQVSDLDKAVEYATSISGVMGAVAVLEDKLAVKGRVKLIPVK
ncbi:UPF0280 family protein [Peptococcaceae bacterium 1198_IL3148]